MEKAKKEIMDAVHLIFELNSKFDDDLKEDLDPIVKHLQNALNELEEIKKKHSLRVF